VHNNSKKLLFVINPIAGGRDKKELISQLQRFCIKEGFIYCFFYTTGEKDAEKLQDVFTTDRYDALVAVGGDGTINLTGKLIVGTNTPLGIIPHGSANGLAKGLGIPENTEGALKIISRFKASPIDTLKINGQDSFHLSDFGFNARIIRRFSESIVRGKVSYLWYGLIEFFTFKPFAYLIETPLLKYEGKAFMMVVTNNNQFGTDLIINPLGKTDDGYFEIVIIKPFSRWRSAHVMRKLVSNTIHRSRYSKLIRCREAVIYNRAKELFHIDGEPKELGEKIEIKIVPKGLYIFRP
jgi:diacylglycerol kinase (ATP)